MTTTILSLDLGTTTGWAIARDHKILSSGSVCFKQDRFESSGMRFTKFNRWLEQQKTQFDINEIVFETVSMRQAPIAGQVYGGFMATVQMFGDTHGLPYEGVPAGTIKKFATGNGMAKKIEMVNAMEKRGHKPKDDNEADALALMYYRLERVIKIGGDPKKEPLNDRS